MKRNPYIIRCYARPEEDHYIGVCIDLDIAVRGVSLLKIREEMTKAIKVYFESLDEANFKDLFPRPVPLSVLLDYYKVLAIVHCFYFLISCRNNFQVFFEQLIPKEFSISLRV